MISSSVAFSNKKFSQENVQNITNVPSNTKDNVELPQEERNRGKRMMGVLMGTLSKFKSEEVDKSEANLKRILLEQRLALKLSQAKQNLGQTLMAMEVDDAEMESRKVLYSTQTYPNELAQIQRDTSEACAQFQQTVTLPALYFKRAQ